jgi:hypothetical protein
MGHHHVYVVTVCVYIYIVSYIYIHNFTLYNISINIYIHILKTIYSLKYYWDIMGTRRSLLASTLCKMFTPSTNRVKNLLAWHMSLLPTVSTNIYI